MDDNFRSFRKLVKGFMPLNDAAERASGEAMCSNWLRRRAASAEKLPNFELLHCVTGNVVLRHFFLRILMCIFSISKK